MAGKKPVIVVEHKPHQKVGRKEGSEGNFFGKSAFMSGNISESYGASVNKIKRPRNSKPVEKDLEDVFRMDSKTLNSVQRLGASALEGRDRKIWEAKRLQELGGISNFKVKMPRKMFEGVRHKQMEKAKAEAENNRLAGLVTGKKAYIVGGMKDKHQERRKRARDDDPTPDNIRGSIMHLGGSGSKNKRPFSRR